MSQFRPIKFSVGDSQKPPEETSQGKSDEI
jgi:hypothetical protein